MSNRGSPRGRRIEVRGRARCAVRRASTDTSASAGPRRGSPETGSPADLPSPPAAAAAGTSASPPPPRTSCSAAAAPSFLFLPQTLLLFPVRPAASSLPSSLPAPITAPPTRAELTAPSSQPSTCPHPPHKDLFPSSSASLSLFPVEPFL